MATDAVQDRHEEIVDSLVTIVQLRATASAQRRFLQNLLNALSTQGSLTRLTPGPSNNVFVIPQILETQLRAKPSLKSTVTWEVQLRTWGALTVNSLSSSALMAVMQRGAMVAKGDKAPSAPVSLINQPMASTAATDTPLPHHFQGPFDWHLDERGANVVNAWAMFANGPKFAGKLPWDDINVGHIDTGYTEHVALGWKNGSSSTVKPNLGHDYWDGPADPDPRDEWLPAFPGHGTRISGAIAGFLTNTPTNPYYGVAPGATIIPYRVTDSVIIDHVKDHVADAIREAVEDGCHVVNISLGAWFGSRKLADALDHAYDNGVIVVCAAGQVLQEVIYPGRYNRCVTMGGVGPGFKPWSSGARGQYVDLCAPADVIRRIKAEKLPHGTAADTVNPNADGSGTSYATATCSGIAALWLAWHGVGALKAHYAAGGVWQIAQAFKKLARQTATPGTWPAGSNDYGSGVINAAALLAAPLPSNGSLSKAIKAAGVFDPND
jgi:lambda repressor-like predicted transcriptional regulator